MRIAINARFLLKSQLEGIGTYTYELSKRLIDILPNHKWVFFFDRDFDRKYIFSDKIKPVVVYPSARHPILWYWWFEKSIPKALEQNHIDLFFSPDSYLSLHTNIPQILSVHDLAFEYYPKTIPYLVNQYYRHYIPKFCHKADEIIAVSEHTKNDIIRHYAIPDDKIHVIPNGVSSVFKPIDNLLKADIKNQYTNNRPYFLYVGAIHPRKNVISILKAFEDLKHKYPSLPHQLLIVGRKSWMNQKLKNYYQQMQFVKDIIWKENINQDTLVKIMGTAEALIYLSLYEGFGLPVLEAMSCGTPVITSSNSPMEDIVKDAGLTISPTNYEEISAAMYQIIQHTELQKKLSIKGLEHAQFYTWENSAIQVAGVIEKQLQKK